MRNPDHIDRIRQRLDQLRAFDSIPGFSRLYYDLIAARIADLPVDDAGVGAVFARYLEHELRFHRTLSALTEDDPISLDDMVSLADKRRIALEEVLDALERLRAGSDAAEATRLLVVAECCYHLDASERVVSYIERAIELGADDPAFHFALGYNRFALAEQAYTALDADTRETVVVDIEGYRAAMLDAVSAFEAGLSGGAMDVHIYRWIGTCLSNAGFDEAADHAFGHAGADDEPPENWDAESPRRAPRGLEALPAITADEVRKVGELLKGTHTIADIMGDDEA